MENLLANRRAHVSRMGDQGAKQGDLMSQTPVLKVFQEVGRGASYGSSSVSQYK
jgi:hypothetical protein